MTITSEIDNDVIIYALEKIISYARRTQHIFVAQCMWWLASIIGLEQGLVIHMHYLQIRSGAAPVPTDVPVIIEELPIEGDPDRQDKIPKECKEYLRDSRRLRDLAKLKSTGTAKTGLINPLAAIKSSLRVSKRKGKDYSKTERNRSSQDKSISGD
jgi:hypothetical protein